MKPKYFLRLIVFLIIKVSNTKFKGEVWPGKNFKYIKKRKLFMEYQPIFFQNIFG